MSIQKSEIEAHVKQNESGGIVSADLKSKLDTKDKEIARLTSDLEIKSQELKQKMIDNKGLIDTANLREDELSKIKEAYKSLQTQ